MLPGNLHKFFWEHPIDTLDEDRHKAFVIERLLEHGDDEAVRWIFRRYERADILEVVRSSRRLSRKTANFWKNYFRLREEDVLCLRESSPQHSLHSWTD
ncbi:MAG: hypothetical protein DDT29_01947 [Dehalococcoidia bacterium]|nr:hypothetical protein [Bacillota bacterium]